MNQLLSIFKNIYSKALLSSALLLSRGISFYLLLLISIVVLGIYNIVDMKNRREDCTLLENKK